ncbi:MAG TPA: SprT family zinc-dependent metalloprotease [Patescibacteria group bacterium]|nr:SprT family zinc-dependent metalloprotease [Patescibacteria group bacterium]
MKKTFLLVRSARRSVGLSLSPDGKLTVRAPIRMSLREIERLVAQKQNWILRKTDEIKKRPEVSPKQFEDGERFLFLGKTYPLRLSDRIETPFLFRNQEFILSRKHQAQGRELLEQWYVFQIRKIVIASVDRYARLARSRYQSLKINGARTRWGSCSSSGNLNFSWRLALAPLWIIDSVAAHEVAHLKIQNHSQAFWSHVGQLYPKYTQARAWLRKNGRRLIL